jgi:long-chain-fatty-acid--coA ligase family protein
LDDTNRVAEALKEVKPHYMCVVPRLLEKIYTKIYENVGKQSLIKRMIFSFATRTAKIHLKQKRKGKRVSFILQELYNFSDKLVFRKLKEALGGNIQMIPCGGALLEPSIGRFFRAIGVNVTLGYGMTETTATVACWDTKFKLKSVGTVLPNIEVKIGENNEILLKGGSITKGYYNNPEENVKAFTSDGYFRTGDAGYLDKEGNLFITERIKELMKTSNGKYIAPQQIEGKVGKDSFIEQIAIIADARKYVSALIVPNYDALVEYAKSLNLKYKNYSDLIKNSQIVDFFQKRLQNLQQGLAAYEQIKKFTLLTTPFSINNNELTPTLKLKRKNIYKNYFKEIEAMYV